MAANGKARKPGSAANSVLPRGIQTVGVFFAAFGGFLTGFAPPEEADPKFAVGISSFTALIVLFLCAALSHRQPAQRHRRIWIGCAVFCLLGFLLAAFFYQNRYAALTFEYPPGATKA